MNKTCTKCGEEKPVDSFYKHRTNTDGKCGCCKECKRIAVKKYRQSEAGKIVCAKAERKYDQSEKGKAAQKIRRKKHPERTRAPDAVRYALSVGKIQRPLYCCVDSSECSGRIEGHHWDYDRPLDVAWLCQKHHRWTHRQEQSNKEGE